MRDRETHEGGSVTPRLSVVIPNFNHTRYLHDAIRSVLGQTRRPFEIIVVDDGSTDNCREVVSAFGEQVRYLFQTNQGLAGARNTGVLAARGELVGLLDADDQWLPSFVSSMLSLATESPDATVYYCCARAVDEQGRMLPRVFGGPPVPPEAVYDRLLRANFLIPSTVVMRRDAVVAAGLFDRSLRSCEDWDLWLRLLPSHRFVGTGACLVQYRLHAHSLSANVETMRRFGRMVIEKHFGPEDGRPDTWSAGKRRAYGGAYRYLLLTSVQRQGDPQVAAGYLRRALQVDPSVASDLDLFYDLALGDQPAGYRGSGLDLDLARNAAGVRDLVAAALTGPDAPRHPRTRRDIRATVYHALGLVAYNTGSYPLSRRFLLRALYYRPALWRDRIVVGDLVKSLGGGLIGRPMMRDADATR